MLNETLEKITVVELETYLNSLEQEKSKEIQKGIHDYRLECTAQRKRAKKREVAKIEKLIDKEYKELFAIRDEILDLLAEIKDIPSDIEELKIAEYMLYRVDIRKAEKVVNKVKKELEKRYKDIQESVESKISRFPKLQNITEIGYIQSDLGEAKLQLTKEQYKLECTEEERKQLIKKELDMIEQAKDFNSIPIPHEILKNLDKDIQSKMQKFNSIREKRIRILNTMELDYEKLTVPREIVCAIDDANNIIDDCKYILTKSEYNSVKNTLTRRKRKIYRSTKDIRSIIETKENKTGIANFNIQSARYLRMANLRDTIAKATILIKENPLDELEEQLEKLKISYEREKQFASVIENLSNGRDGNNAEVKAYEQQINSLQSKLLNSKRIVSEEEEKIKNAKKELLVLWKMEINAAVSKKKENTLRLQTVNLTKESREEQKRISNGFSKLKKASRWKACMHLKLYELKHLYTHINLYRGVFIV